MIRKVKNNKEVTCNICKEVIKVGGYVYDIGRGMTYCHTYCASELLLDPNAFASVSGQSCPSATDKIKTCWNCNGTKRVVDNNATSGTKLCYVCYGTGKIDA